MDPDDGSDGVVPDDVLGDASVDHQRGCFVARVRFDFKKETIQVPQKSLLFIVKRAKNLAALRYCTMRAAGDWTLMVVEMV